MKTICMMLLKKNNSTFCIKHRKVRRFSIKFRIYKDIISITIHYDKYDPTRAGSYIDLPEWIKLKKACIHIKNKVNKCFKYSVQSVVFDIINTPHSQETFHYNKLNDNILNWEGVKFPTGNKGIERFELKNDRLVSINVFEIDDILDEPKK